jgi:hypothetical protein
MHLELLVLCDAATDSAGKLNILGAYDTIMAPSLPVRIQTLNFALRIRFPNAESGKHQVQLNLIDIDGKLIIPPFTAEVGVQIPKTQDTAAVNLILNGAGITFPAAGTYRIDLLINNQTKGSIPLSIALQTKV